MKHQHCLDQLPFYVAGKLSPAERAALDDHLAACDPCRAALDEWQRIAEDVRTQAASRVQVLPPLRTLPVFSSNGRSHLPTPIQEDTMMNPATVYTPSLSPLPVHGEGTGEGAAPRVEQALPLPGRHVKSRHPVITLAAALLVIVLFVGALVALNRGDQHPDSHPGAVLLTLSATPSPVSSPTLIPTQPPDELATPTPIPSLIPTLPPDEPGTPTPAPYMVIPGDLATPTPVPFDGPAVLPDLVRLQGITYEQQGWNNQGPTALTMALSYYGWTHDQQTAANWLKPDPEDKNVSPWEMVTFVNDETTGVYGEIGVKAVYRIGGNIPLLKRLLAAGFPVIAEVSIRPAGEDWMGHYVLLIGYDERNQQFLTYDSYLGSNQGQARSNPYALFDEAWRDFNRTLIVVYRPADEPVLRDALRDYAGPVYGYQMALDTARVEVSRDRADAWAWFNMGTAYDLLGDYDSAATAYDEAFQIGLPWRMLWYQFSPYEAYFFTGRYPDVIAHAEETIATTTYVEESYYWRAMASLMQGDTETAAQDFAQVVTLNPHFFAVQAAQFRASTDPLAFGQAASSPAPLAVIATPTPIPSLVPTETLRPEQMTATWIVSVATGTAWAATAAQASPTPNMSLFQVTATQIVANATGTAALFTPTPPPLPTAESLASPTPTQEAFGALKTDMIIIPGSTFTMGTSAEEGQEAMDECMVYGRTCTDLNLVSDSIPPHAVTLDSFQMEIYEVGLSQYVAFLNGMGSDSHIFGCQGQPCALTSQEQEFSNILYDGTTYSVRNDPLYADYPATYVTWWGAAAYCEALGRRLPTEAEWEHAARGQDSTIYPWGYAFDPQKAMSALDAAPGPVSVYSYPNGTSPYGIFNMAGNVEEWVSDWYQPDYYSTQATGGAVENPQGPFSGTDKVLRGGGWDTYPLFLRSVHRMSAAPGYSAASIGFRCAAGAPPTATPAPDTAVFDDEGRVVVLLMGIDEHPDQIGSSSTGALILLSMDSTAKTVAALTLPRDVWVEYPGLDQSGTLGNASRIGGEINYPGGGAMFAVKTVEKLTGITIPYYIRLNPDAFTTLLDAVGPLQVCPAETIHDDVYQDPVYGTMTVHFDPGCQLLDSVGLLQYVRVRHSDSDFARSARQLEVLLSLRDQLFNAYTLAILLTHAPALWDSLQGDLTTNLTPDELLALVYVAKAIPRENIHQGQLTLDQLESAVSATGEAILLPNAPDVEQLIADLFGSTP